MITTQGLEKLGFVTNVDFELKGDHITGSVWMGSWFSDKPQPTDAEIEAAHAVWQTEYDSQEYARKRLAEYPSIEELTVALWEGVVEERMAAVTSLEGKRQAVKAKYPK
tara:strand:- start:203 stop:529 length:327 start_codon:yes stop_codon:yes gene_type:complete